MGTRGRTHDVVVIGAGVAGLAAAADLRRAGHDVLVLEARRRIGGRILTRRHGELPIELGAEFIHGDAPETARILGQAGLTACDVSGDHWTAVGGRLRREDFWPRIDRVLRRIDPDSTDRSFAAFLAGRSGGNSWRRDRASAREFVQGFHAADPHDVSAQSLAPDDGERPSEPARRAARVVQGYDGVPHQLAHGLRGAIRLASVVQHVTWRPGGVEVGYRSASKPLIARARAAIVSVPLGVLQAPPGARGAIAFDPEPPRLRAALAGLAMGAVQRVVLGFRDLPWSGLRKLSEVEGFERASFLHLRGQTFSVWWTTFPVRSSVLVAWSGGPPARRLPRARGDIVAAALDGLAEKLGTTRRRIAAQVDRTWSHDWQSDPYSRGAYSYVRVGGEDAARRLARPVAGTLFVAGEATEPDQSGTVEGAIVSGRRAARQVRSALA